MSTIGKVRAVFTASSSGLTSGVNSAVGAMGKMQASVDRLRGGMSMLTAINAAQLFGSVASSVSNGVSSLVRYGQAQAEVIDGQSKLAARLGMTYGEFSGLALAGDLAGVSAETVAKAATKADIAFAKAAGGSKTAQAAFSNLGLSMDDLGQMSAADRFSAISEAIAGLPTEAQRAAAAVQVFGKSGVDLLPMFAGGAEGIRQAREQAEKFGLALTTAQGQDVEAMNDSITLAAKAMEGIVNQVVAYLSPAVQAVADTFTGMIESAGGANLGKMIGDGIMQAVRFMATIGDWLIGQFSAVFEYLSSVGQQWGGVTDLFGRAVSFLSGVFNIIQAGLGLVVLGFGAVVEGITRAVRYGADLLGFDTSSMDGLVAGATAFNSEISKGIDKNVADMQKNFGAAFGEGAPQIGKAIAGPLTSAVDAVIAKADASAAEQSKASPPPGAVAGPAAVAEPTALKGIDSRSQEGIAEMFRLMRGDTGDVQQQQLSVLEQIRDGIASGEDAYPFSLEGG
jgi:hypothetical protein